jgi:hypothetical protein
MTFLSRIAGASALPDHEFLKELPETSCEMEWDESWGSNPMIRLLPSQTYAGSSLETDRIINKWRPRLFSLVELSISMAQDLCEISWNTEEEAYPCCPFMKLLEPPSVGKDMRRFCDEACHILIQASSTEEISDAYWTDGRAVDARDVLEWMARWATLLPDENGQFQLWSVFLPCEALEAFYRYVHAILHDYYLEILQLHRAWEEDQENRVFAVGGELFPNLYGEPPETIIYWHPRLICDDQEFTLTDENAEEFRDWAYDAFMQWGKILDRARKEALVEAACQADEICPQQRWLS